MDNELDSDTVGGPFNTEVTEVFVRRLEVGGYEIQGTTWPVSEFQGLSPVVPQSSTEIDVLVPHLF